MITVQALLGAIAHPPADKSDISITLRDQVLGHEPTGIAVAKSDDHLDRVFRNVHDLNDGTSRSFQHATRA